MEHTHKTEMSGFLVLKTSILRDGMAEYLTPMGPTKLHVNPIFEIGPCEPRFSEWIGHFFFLSFFFPPCEPRFSEWIGQFFFLSFFFPRALLRVDWSMSSKSALESSYVVNSRVG